MMRKSYFVYTPYTYRIIMFIGLPVFLFGLQLVIWGFGKNINVELASRVCVILTQSFLIVTEVVSDSFLFGGIQSKDAEKMDFLKTSTRGMQFMKNALTMDLIRRFCTALGIIGAEVVIFRVAGVNIIQGNVLRQINVVLFIVLTTYLFAVLGVVLSRSFGYLLLNAALGYAMSAFAGACWALPKENSYVVVYDVVLILLCIGLSILTVRTAMKKVEGSYYDK